ncbi:MAG TPA: hypothetical protein VFI54_20945 [Solirubrobacteraceae bacterium]|nr:hypothetical protein [Solirubrobacteraceae bacterium]
MRARRLAALILSASAIAGCGSKTTLLHTSSSSSSTSSQSPATTTGTATTTTTAPPGTVKSADGQFATVIPDGFVNARSSVQAPIKIQYLAAAPSHGGFATNINVVAEPSGGQTRIDTIAGLEIAGVKRAEPQAHDFSQIQSLTVDGQPARAIDYLSLPDKHRLLHQYQVFVAKSGTIYTITYSALPSAYSDNLASVKQVTDGWHWLS